MRRQPSHSPVSGFRRQTPTQGESAVIAKERGGGPKPAAPRSRAPNRNQASASAALIESGVIGISRTRAPDAASIALAIAAGTTVTTGSPVPAG